MLNGGISWEPKKHEEKEAACIVTAGVNKFTLRGAEMGGNDLEPQRILSCKDSEEECNPQRIFQFCGQKGRNETREECENKQREEEL